MSEENGTNVPASPEENNKPSELLEIEKAVMDLNAFHSAVKSGSFPGSHAQSVVGLLSFLKQTFQQLEEQYRNHPYIQEEMRKAQEQAAKDKAEMDSMGMVNG
jgi:hypothetical protein